MLTRLYSIAGRMRPPLLVLALVALPLLSGCSDDAMQDTVTGTMSTVLGFVIICAVFHICGF